jgi:hypothetical protein
MELFFGIFLQTGAIDLFVCSERLSGVWWGGNNQASLWFLLITDD